MPDQLLLVCLTAEHDTVWHGIHTPLCSAVQALSPPNSLTTPAYLLQRQSGKKKKPLCYASTAPQQSEHWFLTNTVFVQNTQRYTAVPRKINSIPATFSTKSFYLNTAIFHLYQLGRECHTKPYCRTFLIKTSFYNKTSQPLLDKVLLNK